MQIRYVHYFDRFLNHLRNSNEAVAALLPPIVEGPIERALSAVFRAVS